MTRPTTNLPADSHVHSEWSWDAPGGAMRATCERAVEIGLAVVAFTEHADHTVWTGLDGLDAEHHLMRFADDDAETLTPPPLDAAGYIAAVEECRAAFPGLRILTGLELGEPHRHADAVTKVLSAGTFDRCLGSLHSLYDPSLDGYAVPTVLFAKRPADDVLRTYFAELAELVAADPPFEILAHIDFPVRMWPDDAGPFEPGDYEEEFRDVLRTLAGSGRALEFNTRLPLHSTILRWWHEVGGDAISFGSDAHSPDALAHGFGDAAQLAEASGFRPGTRPHELWRRSG